jgi:hypothetical protein
MMMDKLRLTLVGLVAAAGLSASAVAQDATTFGDIKSSATAYQWDADNDVAKIETMSHDAVVNVKEYGAVGDGLTDDTDAINAAAAAALAKSLYGGTLYFPAGVYGITSKISIFCNVMSEPDALISVPEDYDSIAVEIGGDNTRVSHKILHLPIIQNLIDTGWSYVDQEQTDGACSDHTGPTYTFTSAAASFAAGDADNWIRISTTGASGHFVVDSYKIISVTNGTTVELEEDPTDGTNDTGATYTLPKATLGNDIGLRLGYVDNCLIRCTRIQNFSYGIKMSPDTFVGCQWNRFQHINFRQLGVGLWIDATNGWVNENTFSGCHWQQLGSVPEGTINLKSILINGGSSNPNSNTFIHCAIEDQPAAWNVDLENGGNWNNWLWNRWEHSQVDVKKGATVRWGSDCVRNTIFGGLHAQRIKVTDDSEERDNKVVMPYNTMESGFYRNFHEFDFAVFTEAADQVAYLDIADVQFHGTITLRMTSGFSTGSSFGEVSRRYSFYHPLGGANVTNSYVETITAFGAIRSRYALGDLEMNGTAMRIPIYQLVDSGVANAVRLYVEVMTESSAVAITMGTALSITEAATVSNTQGPNNMSTALSAIGVSREADGFMLDVQSPSNGTGVARLKGATSQSSGEALLHWESVDATDGACADHSASTYTFTSASSAFDNDDVGARIRISTTGDTEHFVEGDYVINSVNSGTSVELTSDPTDGTDETGGTFAIIHGAINGDGNLARIGRIGVKKNPVHPVDLAGDYRQEYKGIVQGLLNFGSEVDQVGFVELGDITFHGCIEVEITPGYSTGASYGKVTRRFGFYHLQGASSILHNHEETVAAFGQTRAAYSVGVPELYGTAIRVPIAQLINTNTNNVRIRVTIWSENTTVLDNAMAAVDFTPSIADETDGVCSDHTGPTYTFTSSSASFAAGHVGSHIYIKDTGDGGNFVVGAYEIDSVTDADTVELASDPTDGTNDVGADFYLVQRETDGACADHAGDTYTFTSAASAFQSNQAGQYIRIKDTGDGGNFVVADYLIDSVTDANTVELTSDPTNGSDDVGGDFFLIQKSNNVSLLHGYLGLGTFATERLTVAGNVLATGGIGLHGQAVPSQAAKINDPSDLSTAIQAIKDVIDVLEGVGMTGSRI